jgi:hypothetical protein
LGVGRITRDFDRADAAIYHRFREATKYTAMFATFIQPPAGDKHMKAIRLSALIAVIIGLWVACGIIITRSLHHIISLAGPLSW